MKKSNSIRWLLKLNAVFMLFLCIMTMVLSSVAIAQGTLCGRTDEEECADDAGTYGVVISETAGRAIMFVREKPQMGATRGMTTAALCGANAPASYTLIVEAPNGGVLCRREIAGGPREPERAGMEGGAQWNAGKQIADEQGPGDGAGNETPDGSPLSAPFTDAPARSSCSKTAALLLQTLKEETKRLKSLHAMA